MPRCGSPHPRPTSSGAPPPPLPNPNTRHADRARRCRRGEPPMRATELSPPHSQARARSPAAVTAALSRPPRGRGPGRWRGSP
jgi:hypothetical protein